MSLSKKDKEQLISLERCERESGRYKLLYNLQEKRDAVIKPFQEKIAKLEKEKTKALIDQGLLYISDGCGKTHPFLEQYNHETNERIKKILRE